MIFQSFQLHFIGECLFTGQNALMALLTQENALRDIFQIFIRNMGSGIFIREAFILMKHSKNIGRGGHGIFFVNRYDVDIGKPYTDLLKLVKDKDYFVLTTNVDHQFQKAGFSEERIFATQGDYGRIQCMKGCHPRTYDAVSMFAQMVQTEKDCKIPSYMVPKCPVCGGPMAMNLRCDQYFVEDEQWNEAAENYGKYLKQLKKWQGCTAGAGRWF
mgnify:CR=1 FL=1